MQFIYLFITTPPTKSQPCALMGRFGTREMEVDNLLRNEVFVDLYRVVQQGLRVGDGRSGMSGGGRSSSVVA